MNSMFQDAVIVWDTCNSVFKGSVLDEIAPLFEGFLLYWKLFDQENRNGKSSAFTLTRWPQLALTKSQA